MQGTRRCSDQPNTENLIKIFRLAWRALSPSCWSFTFFGEKWFDICTYIHVCISCILSAGHIVHPCSLRMLEMSFQNFRFSCIFGGSMPFAIWFIKNYSIGRFQRTTFRPSKSPNSKRVQNYTYNRYVKKFTRICIKNKNADKNRKYLQ